jgi:hypothetical protein
MNDAHEPERYQSRLYLAQLANLCKAIAIGHEISLQKLGY